MNSQPYNLNTRYSLNKWIIIILLTVYLLVTYIVKDSCVLCEKTVVMGQHNLI